MIGRRTQMNGLAKGMIVGSVLGVAAMTALSASSPRTMRRLGRNAMHMKQDMSRRIDKLMMGK